MGKIRVIGLNEQRAEMIFYYLKTNTPPTVEEIAELLGENKRLIGL